MALNGTIGTFKTGTYVVTRTAAATPTNGVYGSGAATTLSIDASIQPASGRELRVLAEAQRGEETRVVYTRTELKTRSPGFEPDVITISGESWTVFRVELFGIISGGHCRAYIARTVVP